MGNHAAKEGGVIMIMKTEKDFIDRMNKQFPNEDWEPIDIKLKSLEYSKYKCRKCGQIYSMQNCEIFRKGRKHLCSKCYKELRKDTLKNQNIIENFLRKQRKDILHYNFFMKEQKNGIRAQYFSFICPYCNKENEFLTTNLITNGEIKHILCSYCEGIKNKKDKDIFRKELEENYPDKYIILIPYEKSTKNVRVKCKKCGFIRDVKPGIILRSGYCPKCDSKLSKGEKFIAHWLNKNDINYVQQKYFKTWNIGIHYFDFYLPDFNLVIEYHGRQHYEFVDYFHSSEEEFIYRQQKDLNKKNEALKQGLNYISINYHNYQQLEEILTYLLGSTTIWEQSRGKCLEIETIQDLYLDKDIVSTSSESQSSS